MNKEFCLDRFYSNVQDAMQTVKKLEQAKLGKFLIVRGNRSGWVIVEINKEGA